MGWVDSLAGKFLDLYGQPGIDWSKYDDDGILISDPRYSYRDEMLARATDLFHVMGTLAAPLREKYRELRASDDRAALTELWQSLQAAGGRVWDSLESGEVTLAKEQTLTMTRDGYANALVGLMSYTASGAYLHLDMIMSDAVQFGVMKPEQLRMHADMIVQMCEAVVVVDHHGGLDDLKEGAAVSGLGIAWLALLPAGAWWAISVIGIAAILGLAYLLHGVFVTSPVQRKAINVCDELAKLGKTAESQACFESVEKMGAPADPFGGLTEKLGLALTIVIVLYGASLALPGLVRAGKEARA